MTQQKKIEDAAMEFARSLLPFGNNIVAVGENGRNIQVYIAVQDKEVEELPQSYLGYPVEIIHSGEATSGY